MSLSSGVSPIREDISFVVDLYVRVPHFPFDRCDSSTNKILKSSGKN